MKGFFRGIPLHMEAYFAKTFTSLLKPRHRRLSVACNPVAGLICLMAFVRKRILRRGGVPDAHATVWPIDDRGAALVARSRRALGRLFTKHRDAWTK